MKLRHRIVTLLLIALLSLPVIPGDVTLSCFTAQAQTKKKNTSAKSQSTTAKTNSKNTTKNSGNKKKNQQKKNSQSKKPETSADVQKRKKATEKEIQLTKQKIVENEKAVKSGLAELAKMDQDIKESQTKLNNLTAQVNTLDEKINTLQTSIDEGEQRLELMRTNYLSAVKKMRAKKQHNSDLAFIFSSKSFNQALRRMRYLRQFSAWKERQSAAISQKVKELSYQKELLAQSRSEMGTALTSQRSAQNRLESQRKSQDAIVSNLKANGTALKSHLAKKQAEANQLNNRIAALISEEQRRAREEEARREAARKEAERKAADEARRKAEQAKITAEQQSQAQKDSKKAETKKNDDKKKDKDYAEARKRDKRTDKDKNSKKETAKTQTPTKSSGTSDSGFAAAKGSLPRPVSGSFRIISPFGRHPLPELPDVEYENPGIDAEVSNGASAQAVYAGKVSGVYLLPGYNTVVIINHGTYYTVYGNIASPQVKVGDSVSQGQSLGRLAQEDGRTVIHFEVWKNREKLNPSAWIR